MRFDRNPFLLLFGRINIPAALCSAAVFWLTACAGAPGTANATASLNDSARRNAHKPVAGEVTHVDVSRVGQQRCEQAPVTFGQVFRAGDVSSGQTVVGEYDDQTLPTQTDVRARNADGSARHAVITLVMDCDAAARGADVSLVARDSETTAGAGALRVSDVLATAFDADISLDLDGTRWHLNARELLTDTAAGAGCDVGATYCERRFDGPLMAEWVVGGPLRNEAGRPHPHLAAYFAVRAYGPSPVTRVRVDVTVENDWAYAANPQNYQYTPTIEVNGQSAYRPGALTHYRQARWHKTVWWGESEDAPLYAALDPDYLQSTPAVPRYEPIALSKKMMSEARQDCAPMDHCDQTRTMGRGGAQAAIGPLPRWSAAFVMNPNYRMFRFMTANTDALGAYDVHYRSQDTGVPMSVEAHPCATLIWPAREQTCDVPPHGDDRFPECASKGACKSPLTADMAHHPAPATVAYLATGDWFYETEMEYWANWVVFWQNPKYREYDKGLVHQTQLRGQAWMLRTLGDAAYLLPDSSDKKRYFNEVVQNNIDYYNETYADHADEYPLGVVPTYNTVIYTIGGEKRVGVATWQQSFFTWATGSLANKGFDGASRLHDWSSRFQIGTMTAPGFCWELASAYALRLRDEQRSPLYTTFAEIYDKTFPELSASSCDATVVNEAIREHNIRKRFNYPAGTMVGYPRSGTGFVANFQIGLASAAMSNTPGAAQAWKRFVSRSVPTNYASSPQFAVIPD